MRSTPVPRSGRHDERKGLRPRRVESPAPGGVPATVGVPPALDRRRPCRPSPQGSPPGRRLLAISLRRPIQRGEAGIVTHLRVACPPQGVAVRFALDARADVMLEVTRSGRRVARLRARLSAGPHVWRFRVART